MDIKDTDDDWGFMGTCEDCGKYLPVCDTTCPFAEEIWDIEDEITVCRDCYQEREWDI